MNTWQYTHEILTDGAGIDRIVTVALPFPLPSKPIVLFCADGQVVETLCRSLSTSASCDLPILIGVHSHQATRAQDYLFDGNANYLNHEEFFVKTLRSWVTAEYRVSIVRSTSVIFGFSNGGAFALTAALRHPDCFAAAISFSTPKLPILPSLEHCVPPMPAIYLAAGRLGPEKQIRKNVLQLSRWLRKENLAVTVSEKHAGHTMAFWASELPIAVDWFQRPAA